MIVLEGIIDEKRNRGMRGEERKRRTEIGN
jgi:hypothetical protein